MKKSKLFVLSLTALLSLGVIVGCGNNDVSTNQPSNDNSTVQPSDNIASKDSETKPSDSTSEQVPSNNTSDTTSENQSNSDSTSNIDSTSNNDPVDPVDPVEKSWSATSVSIDEVGGKPVVSISGSYEGYSKEELLGLDWQYDFNENPMADHGDWNGSWNRYLNGTATWTVDEANKTWKASIDVSSLSDYAYTMHFNVGVEESGDNVGQPRDLKLASAYEKEIKIGTVSYKVIVDPTDTSGKFFWGNIGLYIKNEAAPIQEATNVDIKEVDGKVALTVSGTSSNYSKQEFESKPIYFDFERNDNVGHKGWEAAISNADKVILERTFDEKSGEWSISFDISSLPADDAFTMHFVYNSETKGDLKPSFALDKTITALGKDYQLVCYPNIGNDGSKFWGCVGVITTTHVDPIVYADTPINPTLTPVDGEEGKYVLSVENAKEGVTYVITSSNNEEIEYSKSFENVTNGQKIDLSDAPKGKTVSFEIKAKEEGKELSEAATMSISIPEEKEPTSTLEKPLSVEDAIAIANEYKSTYGGQGDVCPELNYVTGLVTKIEYVEKNKTHNIWLANGETNNAIEFYSADFAEGISVNVGDTIVGSGFLTLYNETPELTSNTINETKVYPNIISSTHNSYDISVSVENATVTLSDDSIVPSKANSGDVISLKIVPSTGYDISEVKIGGVGILPKDGVYSFTVSHKNDIVVTTVVHTDDVKTVAFDFKSDISDFDTWGTSYSAHSSTKGIVKVDFASANHQSSTITTMPVSKGGAYTVSVEGKDIQSFKATFGQWTTKAQKVTISYSLDGKTWVETNVNGVDAFTEGGLSVDLSEIEGNVQYIKVTFSSTSNQIGYDGIEVSYL